MNELYDDKQDDVRMLAGRIWRSRMKKLAAIMVAALVTVVLVRQSVVGQDAAVQMPAVKTPAEVQAEAAGTAVAQPSGTEIVKTPAEVQAEAAGTVAAQPSGAATVPVVSGTASPAANVLVGGRAETTAAAGAITSTGGTSRVTIRIEDATLTDMIRIFMQVADANIVIASTNVSSSIKVAPVLLRDVEWLPALGALLRPYNLTVKEARRGSNIYEVQDFKPEEAQPWVTEIVMLKYASAGDVRASATNLLRSSVKKQADDDDERISIYPAGNALVVQATQARLDEIRKIIQMLDVPRKQVYVEVKFAELTGGNSSDVGIDWRMLKAMALTLNSAKIDVTKGKSILDTHTLTGDTKSGVDSTAVDGGASTVTRTAGESADDAFTRTATKGYLNDPVTGKMNGNMVQSSLGASIGPDLAVLTAEQFGVVVSALEGSEDASLLSNPKLIVANEATAVIDMTTREPYLEVTRQQSVINNIPQPDIITAKLAAIPGKANDDQQAFFQSGIKVSVTPRIEDNGDTTITIMPELSRVISHKQVGDVIVPVIDAKSVTTIFRLADGKTAVIGGLIETTEQEVVSRIPILGQVPIIGTYLFSHKSKQKVQKEILIFVTVGHADANPKDVKVGLPHEAKLIQQQMAAQASKDKKAKSFIPWRR